ncbi:LsmAD domain protein [Spraguea lophii 42_110]|uniref:LsmAD domain protein n=1 Tax=Spraguea lophii (strain 42_110) TaxID=1358809 RepID=S7XJM1_SPRLO|nr:LsmAD domain protein [Spraguea lophii 42_110]
MNFLVEITTTNNKTFVGNLLGMEDDNLILDNCCIDNDMSIKYKIWIKRSDIVEIEEINGDINKPEDYSNINKSIEGVNDIVTDKEMVKKDKKEKDWKSMRFDGDIEILEGSARNWNQFEANEKLFGVKPHFDESLYTEVLDKNAEYYKKNLDEALKIEKEILSSKTRDSHRLEERGIRVNGNEEEKYSLVKKFDDDEKTRKGKKKGKDKKRNIKRESALVGQGKLTEEIKGWNIEESRRRMEERNKMSREKEVTGEKNKTSREKEITGEKNVMNKGKEIQEERNKTNKEKEIREERNRMNKEKADEKNKLNKEININISKNTINETKNTSIIHNTNKESKLPIKVSYTRSIADTFKNVKIYIGNITNKFTGSLEPKESWFMKEEIKDKHYNKES